MFLFIIYSGCDALFTYIYYYDMSVANEASRPVPNGVLLPFTIVYT